ncbi:MAG: pentapeptide repeat-containing protein, partial [Deltaproteobacteria bacterium]
DRLSVLRRKRQSLFTSHRQSRWITYDLVLGPIGYQRALYLERAELGKAKLRHLRLDGANFQFANLEEADLYGTSLRSANLLRANLIKADLIRADLSKANLSGAKNICKAKLDEYVRKEYCSSQAESPQSNEKP